MDKKLTVFILGLLPIFFLPVTQNYYDTNKWMMLSVGALGILIFWAIALLRITKPLRPACSWSAIGFGAVTIASVISLVWASTNKIEALLSPFGPITFGSLTILVLAGSFMIKQEKMWLRWILYAVTALLGLIALYQALGIRYFSDPLWTPTGSTATTIALFFITLSFLVPETMAVYKKRDDHGALALHILSLGVIAAGAGITMVQFIPNISSMLPFDVGMVAASRIFKNPTTAAIGFGAENFVTAFTLSRPAGLTANFGTNADFFLHILTVYGIVGLAASLILSGSFVSGKNNGWFIITKLLCIVALLLIPPTISLLSVIAIIFILTNDTPSPKPRIGYRWIRIAVGILIVLVAGSSLYFVLRAYAAEVIFFQSLRAASARDGTKTYTLQIRAIVANTFVSRYHLTYSQTSLSLADSIAGQENKNDQDTQLVGQLLQQAVREAKTAVTLNPQNVAAWENLGLTYQTIIPVASEAAGWALTTYQQAARLDPNNPTLFVNIGSILVAQKQYDAAIAAFQRAIQLSPSYANAYYNLANAYKLKRDTVNQAKALTQALKLVAPESVDYYKIKHELDALQ